MDTEWARVGFGGGRGWVWGGGAVGDIQFAQWFPIWWAGKRESNPGIGEIMFPTPSSSRAFELLSREDTSRTEADCAV